MTEEERKYFSDIISAIDLIEEFVESTEDFASYEKDHKTHGATERQLAIVSEALNQLRKINPENLPEHRIK